MTQRRYFNEFKDTAMKIIFESLVDSCGHEYYVLVSGQGLDTALRQIPFSEYDVLPEIYFLSISWQLFHPRPPLMPVPHLI